MLSVTAVDSCRDGYLTIFACGPRPTTSNINYEVGRTTAGMAITAMTNRTVCVYAATATDVVVDVIGAFTNDGQPFHPMTPTRWVDTRGGTQITQPVGVQGTGGELQVPVRGQGGVPAGATAVWINLTVADPTAPTVLLAYPGPCGSAPLASTVNAGYALPRRRRSSASALMARSASAR